MRIIVLICIAISREQLRDVRIQIRKACEDNSAQPRENPALRHLHRAFQFGLVPRTARPHRDQRRAVVRREIEISRVRTRLVATPHDDAAAQLITDEGRRYAAEKAQRPRLAGQKIGRACASPRRRGSSRGTRMFAKRVNIAHDRRIWSRRRMRPRPGRGIRAGVDT